MAIILDSPSVSAALGAGLEQTLRLIAPNFGPTGKWSALARAYQPPQFSRSGRAILEQLALEDPGAQLGLDLAKASALRLGTAAGDGATLTLLLTAGLFDQGRRAIASGINPMQLRRGITQASRRAVERLRGATIPLTTLEQVYSVAKIASGDEAIAQLLLEAFQKASLHGIVTTESSLLPENQLLHGGIRYDYGYASPLFANDETGRVARLDKPRILLLNQVIADIQPLLPILRQAQEQDVSLLIITREIREQPMGVILRNVQAGRLKIIVANAPGHGETRRRNMAALAARTGAVLVEEHCGLDLSRCGLEICGRAQSAVIEKYSTLLSGIPQGDEKLLHSLKCQTEALLRDNTDPEEEEELKTTLGILSGDSVRILVGGVTQVDADARKQTIDNALYAVYTALETGLLPGGGKGLLLAASALTPLLDDGEPITRAGANSLRQALVLPAKALADNCGYSGSYVAATGLSSDCTSMGFDVETGEFADLFACGIVDPAGTVTTALELAVETAGAMLTTQAGIIQK